jgi:hypothetical protein
MSLPTPHGFAPGGCAWLVGADGIGIDGHPPQRTPGEPATVRRVLAWFGPAIEAAAAEFSVPAVLLVALICNEAAGGQPDQDKVCTARREEPGWVSDDHTPERVSVGCCQTLLSTARLALADPQLSADDLCRPSVSIRAAAAYVARHVTAHHWDPVLVAAVYNAGGAYLEDIPTNRWRLRCFPMGSGQYIDRFVLWYNDAAAVLAQGAGR